jgi:hypothetical protein
MTEYPITPSDELIGRWIDTDEGGPNVISRIATRAAQWGADQELDACCEVLNEHNPSAYWGGLLRSRRRPKPQSLKQRALKGLDVMIANGHLDGELAAAIREVLEASHD